MLLESRPCDYPFLVLSPTSCSDITIGKSILSKNNSLLITQSIGFIFGFVGFFIGIDRLRNIEHKAASVTNLVLTVVGFLLFVNSTDPDGMYGILPPAVDFLIIHYIGICYYSLCMRYGIAWRVSTLLKRKNEAAIAMSNAHKAIIIFLIIAFPIVTLLENILVPPSSPIGTFNLFFHKGQAVLHVIGCLASALILLVNAGLVLMKLLFPNASTGTTRSNLRKVKTNSNKRGKKFYTGRKRIIVTIAGISFIAVPALCFNAYSELWYTVINDNNREYFILDRNGVSYYPWESSTFVVTLVGLLLILIWGPKKNTVTTNRPSLRNLKAAAPSRINSFHSVQGSLRNLFIKSSYPSMKFNFRSKKTDKNRNSKATTQVV